MVHKTYAGLYLTVALEVNVENKARFPALKFVLLCICVQVIIRIDKDVTNNLDV